MAESTDKIIEIPIPANRPKERVRASHPQQPEKPETLRPLPTVSFSRFEPPAIQVEIPSHGRLYIGKTNDPDLAQGIIKIRQMTLKEEKILTTDRFVQDGRALDMILENCIKSAVNPYDLLSSDRVYLLFYLRGMSYGLDYDFAVKCYHCGFNFEQTVSINKLEIAEWETTPEEPIIMTLPMSKFAIKAHFMRGHDEKKLTEKARELRNINQSDSAAADSISLLIDEITTDEGEILTLRDKEDFVNNMVAGDADYFRDQMNDKDCGLKPLKHIYCPKCQGELEFSVPLGRNFFRRSRQREES
jgi:hypothetical protein